MAPASTELLGPQTQKPSFIQLSIDLSFNPSNSVGPISRIDIKFTHLSPFHCYHPGPRRLPNWSLYLLQPLHALSSSQAAGLISLKCKYDHHTPVLPRCFDEILTPYPYPQSPGEGGLSPSASWTPSRFMLSHIVQIALPLAWFLPQLWQALRPLHCLICLGCFSSTERQWSTVVKSKNCRVRLISNPSSAAH